MIFIPAVPILLDACCLLNLYASGRFGEIAETFSKLAISDYVIRHEAFYIRKRITNPATGDQEKIKMELGPYISSGSVSLISNISEDENETFVDLAGELDDGEAITISLALHRHYMIATDDRKALRVIARSGSITSISTLEIIKIWAFARKMENAEIKNVLLNLQFCASYQPGEKDPMYDWWKSMTA